MHIKLVYLAPHPLTTSNLLIVSGQIICHVFSIIIPPLSAITNFSTKYFVLSKFYTDEVGI